jgi:hypothetical protein
MIDLVFLVGPLRNAALRRIVSINDFSLTWCYGNRA